MDITTLILPSIFLGGIGIAYYTLRTTRGSSITKQYVKAALIKMRNEAIAFTVTALVVITITQVIAG
jgi:hypothetical protein